MIHYYDRYMHINYGNILKDIKIKLKDLRTLPKGVELQRLYRVDQRIY